MSDPRIVPLDEYPKSRESCLWCQRHHFFNSLLEQERVWVLKKTHAPINPDQPFPRLRRDQHALWLLGRNLVQTLADNIVEAPHLLDRFVELQQQFCPWGLAEFIPIIPSRPLGGFVFGTLNFRARKARMLVELGYRDTLELICKRAEPIERQEFASI